MWPGTGLNRRHEDFQSSDRSGPMCCYRSSTELIQLVLCPCVALISRFEPIDANSSGKVVAKQTPDHLNAIRISIVTGT